MDSQKTAKYLLEQMQKGSEHAFAKFYNIYAPFILHIAQDILQDNLEAEDVAHDILLEIYDHPEKYDANRGSIKAWLAVKTKNHSIDRLRKKRPLLVNKLKTIDRAADVETEMAVLSQIEQQLILEALEEIPISQREVIYGAYYKGKTQAELAKQLNKPLGTIKSRIRYGLRNLQKYKRLNEWIRTR